LQVGDSPLGAAARNADVPPPLANRRRNKANSDSLLMAYYIVTFLASSRLHSWQTHSSATATSSVSHAACQPDGIASSLVMMDNGGASIKIRTEQYLAGCERGVRQGRTRGPALGAKTTPPREIDKTRLNREKTTRTRHRMSLDQRKTQKFVVFFWGGKFWFRALPGPAPVGPNADASSLSNNTPEHSTVLNPGVAFLPDPGIYRPLLGKNGLPRTALHGDALRRCNQITGN
jgi:hypothetical protein